jgi:hypothetical protein
MAQRAPQGQIEAPLHLVPAGHSRSDQHAPGTGGLHTPCPQTKPGPHSNVELQQIDEGGGGPSHQPICPPHAQTAPHGHTHAPPQLVPSTQSPSLQHCPGGGFISQLPATHTCGAFFFCGQALSVVQHPGGAAHLPI